MMKAILRSVTACVAAFMLAPESSGAESAPSPDDRREVTLDIDNDGATDRAVLMRNPASNNFDLSIYLAVGTGPLDPSHKPALLKRSIADARITGFESKGKGSLVVIYGCGGCSNDYETALTIVHRGGTFLVAGYTYSWDTRQRSGTCDVNFLTGKGTMSRNLGKARAIKGRFAPVKLADWSDEKRPKACSI
jgi:hypothetical protein